MNNADEEEKKEIKKDNSKEKAVGIPDVALTVVQTGKKRKAETPLVKESPKKLKKNDKEKEKKKGKDEDEEI